MDVEAVILLRKIFKTLVVIAATLVVIAALTATFTSIEVAEAFFKFEGWDLL